MQFFKVTILEKLNCELKNYLVDCSQYIKYKQSVFVDKIQVFFFNPALVSDKDIRSEP